MLSVNQRSMLLKMAVAGCLLSASSAFTLSLVPSQNAYKLPRAALTSARRSTAAASSITCKLDISRRDALVSGVGLLALLGAGKSQRASAFENRSMPKGRYPPMPGAPKRGVGEGPKNGELKFCTGEPNCFTSSSREEDQEHYYPPWQYSGKSRDAAMADLLAAINKYPPGHDNIDGGGFKVAKQQDNYVWVQFESAKRGYVDDFELALVEDGKVLVRSSSRLGYLDFGVNAKRINWFANALNQVEGWKCAAIDAKSHPDYFAQNAGR